MTAHLNPLEKLGDHVSYSFGLKVYGLVAGLTYGVE